MMSGCARQEILPLAIHDYVFLKLKEHSQIVLCNLYFEPRNATTAWR